MRIVSYKSPGGGAAAGVVIDEEVVALRALDGAPDDVIELRAGGPDLFGEVERKARDATRRTPLAEVALRAPIARPSKYLAIGFNFTSHLDEIEQAAGRPEFAEPMRRFAHLREAFPDQTIPTFFNKQVSSITGPFDDILAPRDSAMLDYEGELVVVIGRRTCRVEHADALRSVAGYTVGNDVSVRD
jgi:2-keto-4-pentenoate hydratase/2-oxohepta-3-ene-1,7-dioic acid hydratase in catechol pathway